MHCRLQDIADAVGLHVTTVSMALRQSPKIALATRQRILAMAESMGYRRNPLVSALMKARRTGKSTKGMANLVLLIGEMNPWGLASERMVETGIRRTAEAAGYSLETISITDARRLTPGFWKMLMARGCRGLIWSDTAPIDSISEVPDHTFAQVAFCRPIRGMLSVHSHSAHNIRLCGDYISRKGLQRPGLVLEHFIDEGSEHTYRLAFLDWQMQNLPKANRIDPFIFKKQDKFDAWVKHSRVDCLVAGSRMAVDLPQVLLDFNPSLDTGCGVFSERELIGKIVARMLIDKIERNELENDPACATVMIDGSWIEDHSPLK